MLLYQLRLSAEVLRAVIFGVGSINTDISLLRQGIDIVVGRPGGCWIIYGRDSWTALLEGENAPGDA